MRARLLPPAFLIAALALAALFVLACGVGISRVQLLDSRGRQTAAESQQKDAKRQEQEAKRPESRKKK